MLYIKQQFGKSTFPGTLSPLCSSSTPTDRFVLLAFSERLQDSAEEEDVIEAGERHQQQVEGVPHVWKEGKNKVQAYSARSQGDL